MSTSSVPGLDTLTGDVVGVAKAGGTTDQVADSAGGDRGVLEAARDRVAAQVRRRVDDFEATAALQTLNRALADSPPTDPFDWQVRWERRRKP